MSSVAAVALFAVAAPVANAEIKNGNKNSLTISGQVVRALWTADDGVSSDVFNTDGDWTGTRVRWVAKGTLNANVTAGATIEMDVAQSNEPGSVTMSNRGTAGTESADSAWTIRHEYVWVNHKKMGKVSLGQTNSASNGRSESDYSGTGIFAGSNGKSYGQGISFINGADSANPTKSSVTVGEAFSNFDGASRTDVLRYDTPSFMGIKLAASVHAGGNADAGVDYQGKFGAVKVRVQAGYLAFNAKGTKDTQINGSLAVLHDSGLNASFAMGRLSYDTAAATGVEDPDFMYGSIGYKAKIFGVGGTNFNVKWQQTDDKSQDSGVDNSEAEAVGIAVVQSFDAIGASIGLEYMNYSFDADNAGAALTFDDVDVFTLMTVFKF
jgi:hypothetical protein